jgi:peptidoglycan/LPS O-acetylase OafA/YrhL
MAVMIVVDGAASVAGSTAPRVMPRVNRCSAAVSSPANSTSGSFGCTRATTGTADSGRVAEAAAGAPGFLVSADAARVTSRGADETIGAGALTGGSAAIIGAATGVGVRGFRPGITSTAVTIAAAAAVTATANVHENAQDRRAGVFASTRAAKCGDGSTSSASSISRASASPIKAWSE